MRIQTLGCSASVSGDLRTSCYLVDEDILIDAGTGAGDLTLDLAASVGSVFLTHSHLDHCALLPMLADAAGELRSAPLDVYALPETIASLRRHMFNGELWPDYTVLPAPENPYIRFIPVAEGETVTLRGRRITALPTCHSVPCVGYRIDSGAASLVYSADTGYCARFWELLNRIENLKYLLVETTFRNANESGARRSGHMTANLLAQGLALMERSAELYIVHMEAGSERATMDEVLQCAGRYRPRMLTRGHLFEL